MSTVIAIAVLTVSLLAWNLFAGFAATFAPAALLFAAEKRAERDPGNPEKTRTYHRSVAGARLFNHAVTTLGSLAICAGSIGFGLPIWAAIAAFVVYFGVFRARKVFEAVDHFIKGDAMPEAAAPHHETH
jgi:hypothetical protein